MILVLFVFVFVCCVCLEYWCHFIYLCVCVCLYVEYWHHCVCVVVVQVVQLCGVLEMAPHVRVLHLPHLACGLAGLRAVAQLVERNPLVSLNLAGSLSSGTPVSNERVYSFFYRILFNSGTLLSKEYGITVYKVTGSHYCIYSKK